VKIFREHAPAVDLNRLTANLARVAELDRQLDVTLAQLTNDLPSDANAIAAAGIAFRAQINRSASMIELGVSAVDALRRAGWTLTAPVARAAADLAAQESAENAAERAASDIPDDWAQ
jgi:hypothetical protein